MTATDRILPLERQPLPTPAPDAAAGFQAKLEALQRHQHHVALVELEQQEPECTCTQTDVDIFDPRGCEYHDSHSSWNRALRTVTAVEQYQDYDPAKLEEDCPF